MKSIHYNKSPFINESIARLFVRNVDGEEFIVESFLGHPLEDFDKNFLSRTSLNSIGKGKIIVFVAVEDVDDPMIAVNEIIWAAEEKIREISERRSK